MIETTEDITAIIGPLYAANPSEPMYSYSNPAYNFWQGAFNALTAHGYSRSQAFEFLRSKHARWMFDGSSSEVCQFMGELMTRQYLIANKMKDGQI